MSDGQLFDYGDDELLMSVYQKHQRTLDDLPYTTEFEAIYDAIVGGGSIDEPMGATSRAALFHRLHNLRKAGKLPKLGRARESAPRISEDQQQILCDLVEGAVGRLSLRDQLPYTSAFETLVTQFNARAGLNLSAHAVWRIVAKLAK